MYRNEDKKQDATKWQGWADVFQFGTLGLLFGAILVLNSLSKQQARVAVWYIAGFLFVTATMGFVLGMIATKKTSTYLHAEGDRVGKLLDEGIQRLKR
jgi:hypothetical protein